jgi:hypothetical protein
MDMGSTLAHLASELQQFYELIHENLSTSLAGVAAPAKRDALAIQAIRSSLISNHLGLPSDGRAMAGETTERAPTRKRLPIQPQQTAAFPANWLALKFKGASLRVFLWARLSSSLEILLPIAYQNLVGSRSDFPPTLNTL